MHSVSFGLNNNPTRLGSTPAPMSSGANGASSMPVSSPFSIPTVPDSFAVAPSSSLISGLAPVKNQPSLQFGRSKTPDNPFAEVISRLPGHKASVAKSQGAAMAMQSLLEQDHLERERREKLQKQQDAQQNARNEETRSLDYQGKALDLSDPIKKLRQLIAGLEAKKVSLVAKDSEQMPPAKKEAEIARIQSRKIQLESILSKLEAANGKLPPKIKMAIKVPIIPNGKAK